MSQAPASRVLHRLSRFSQSPLATAAALVMTIGFLGASWLAPRASPVLGAFEAISSGVTLVMVFTLQHTQARQQVAVQRKLDEILQSLPNADNRLVQIEQASDHELNAHAERHSRVRADAAEGPR